MYFFVQSLEGVEGSVMSLCLQELQYVLRQGAPQVTKEHLPRTNNKGLDTDRAASPLSQGHKTTARPEVTTMSAILL